MAGSVLFFQVSVEGVAFFPVDLPVFGSRAGSVHPVGVLRPEFCSGDSHHHDNCHE
jgi:hypothetical protein